jgi:hypothetical protein
VTQNRHGIVIEHWVVTGLVGLSATLISSSLLAAGPYGSIEVGNWKVGTYTNDANGTRVLNTASLISWSV